MQCYIGTGLTPTPVQIEVLPQLSKALDTTNDSFTCTLKANTVQTPYAPMTPFKVVYDDNTEQIFWIINDSVSVFSLNPITYKHSLTLVQYRYFLNKHLVRNSVFNQPRESKRKLYTAFSEGKDVAVRYKMAVSDLDYIWYEGLQVKSPSKLRTFSYKLEIYGILQTQVGEPDAYQTNEEMVECSKQSIQDAHCYFNSDSVIKIIDTNNNNYVIATIDLFNAANYIGKEQYDDQIKDAVNQYLSSHSSVSLKALYQSTDDDIEHACFILKGDSEEVYPDFLAYFIHFYVYTELYNYSMYDVLDTLLKQYRLTSDNLGSKREQLFYLPTANSTGQNLELYNLLKTTYPPDTLSFTQATWYEVLTEIFRFYDAGFKFNENKLLQIEYYNETNKEFDKSLTSVSLTQADKNYCKNRISEYQNAIHSLDVRVPTRANTLGVPQSTEYAIVLPKPIYAIEEIYFKIPQKLEFKVGALAYNNLSMPSIELTPYFINQDVWSNLAADYPENKWQELYQNNTIPYQRGSNTISVSTYYKDYWKIEKSVLKWVLTASIYRFMGIPANNQSSNVIDLTAASKTSVSSLATEYYRQMFNIKYLSEFNGRVQTETVTKQYNGEMLVNQSSSQIDLNKFGLSMLVDSLKDGEPTLSASCEITPWEDRVEEGDYFIDTNGNKWIATVVNYSILPNGNTKCSIEFTKNFNMLALRIKSDKQKRLTQISRDLGLNSEDNYVDYVYATDINPVYMPEGYAIALDSRVLESIIGQTFKYKRNDFYVDKLGLAGMFYQSDANNSYSFYLPMTIYGAGNCVCFEMQYDDPLCAGYRLTYDENDGYRSTAVLYTDNDGWKEKVTIRFYNSSDEDKNKGVDCQAFPYLLERFLGEDKLTVIGEIRNLAYYKKHNEIFALNYQWCFLPLPSQIDKFFIGNKFINENFATTPDKIKGKDFYLRFTTNNSDFQYSIMDVKGVQEGEELLKPIRITTSQSNNIVTLSIYDDNLDPDEEPTRSVKTWAIVDENGDIYFASNTPTTFDLLGSVKIYFITRKQRI